MTRIRPHADRDVVALSYVDRAARATVRRGLAAMGHGRLTVVEDDTVTEFGPGGGKEVTVTVHHPAAWRLLVTGGSAGLGEGYHRGFWDADDLTSLIRLAILNTAAFDRWRERVDRRTRAVVDPMRRLRRQNPRRDRDNIRAHYDLSNDFFATFLDRTMTYSSGVFTSPGVTLEDAQIAKLDRLCRKLELGAGDEVVEIGTGWGSFALHAAVKYGCRVTTTTLSDEQHALATARVASAGLGDRVTVLHEDYRNLTGTFDAAVSIEMIEAVDWREHDTYFAKVASLLRPEGRLGLQAITMADQRYERARHTTDYIKRFIFPGGCLPSITSMATAASRASDLRFVDLEDLSLHYAETLSRWDRNLVAARAELPSLGLDETFERMWHFYLAYCEGAFLERHVSVVQGVLARSAWRPSGLSVRPV